MPTLTIFSTPKPFTDSHIATIQRNAIASWVSLGDQVQVLLIGDEPGMAQVAAAFDVPHLAQVQLNEWGTPLISSIFSLAQQHSTSPFLAYVNADIILTPDLLKAAHSVAAHEARFLIIGQRWDLEVNREMTFGPGWVEVLRTEAQHRGRLHPPAGSDYFVYPRGSYRDLPDFAVGRAGWDNWMIHHACRSGWAVVDATADVMVIHQDHDYRHLPQGQPHYLLDESDVNRALAGGKANMYTLFDANKRLVDGQVIPIPDSLPRLIRRLEIWLTPRTVKPHGLRWALAQRLRRWRRRQR